MKKITRKFYLLLIALLCLTLASCGDDFFEEGTDTEPLDPNKTTIYIGNYYGGLGDKWLDVLTTQYEATHPDVQFKIENDKTPYLLDNIKNNISSSKCSLFFVEKIYYYDMVNQGSLADISDVVTSSLSEFGEEGTIEDKLDEQYKEYLANNEICDGKYYALPTYTAHYHMVYDVDLFEQKKLFMGKNSTDTNIAWIDGKTPDTKSAGVDGVFGTYDDGLPATMVQFEKLVEKMRQKNITPFIWSGQYSDYSSGILTSIYADYEGADSFSLNYTFNGSTKLNGSNTPTTITEANAYELQAQTGKLKALEFARYITSDSINYASSSGLLTSTHLEVQDEYIASRPENNGSTIKPIGIIFEGDWWENEAQINGDFNSMVNMYGEEYAYGTRRFSVMPFPKLEGSAPEKTILSTSAQNAFFINNHASEEEKAICKDFLKFCHTESALQIFTQYTGMVRPFDYEITEEQYNDLTYYSKTLYEIYKSANTKIVYDLNRCDTRIQNPSYFVFYWKWTSSQSGGVYEYPFHDFIDNKNMTADSYFKGLKEYHKSQWSRFTQ